MAMNYIEASNGASREHLEQYADGISQINQLAENLQSQGLLPERFTQQLPELHPSLDGKVRVESLMVGGKSITELLDDIKLKGVKIGRNARWIMPDYYDFETLGEPQLLELATIRVGDLVPNPESDRATTEEIWAARDEKGMHPVPQETPFHYILEKGEELYQREDDLIMNMQTIRGFSKYRSRVNTSFVFAIGRGVAQDKNSIWLYTREADPQTQWPSDFQFTFRLA